MVQYTSFKVVGLPVWNKPLYDYLKGIRFWNETFATSVRDTGLINNIEIHREKVSWNSS